jgi:hypothetical protein
MTDNERRLALATLAQCQQDAFELESALRTIVWAIDEAQPILDADVRHARAALDKAPVPVRVRVLSGRRVVNYSETPNSSALTHGD